MINSHPALISRVRWVAEPQQACQIFWLRAPMTLKPRAGKPPFLFTQPATSAECEGVKRFTRRVATAAMR